MLDVLRLLTGGSILVAIILALYYVPATIIPMVLLGFGFLIVGYILGAAVLQFFGLDDK